MRATDKELEPLPGIAPRLALGQIDFPSDNISLASLRRAHPGEFDTLGVNFFDGGKMGKAAADWPQEGLSEMIHIERHIAQQVFEAAVQGQARRFLASTDADDRGFVDDLCGHYVRYGLAKGQHEAKRLIESIVSQAEQQAKQFQKMVRGSSP